MTRISELGSITGAETTGNDLFPVVDVSDTTQNPTGTTKKLSRTELATAVAADTALTSQFVALPLEDRVNGQGAAWDEDNQIWVAAELGGDVSDLIVDEDDFASNLDDKAPSQQSTKAYVDGRTPARTVNAQTGTTYDFALTDVNNGVTHANASPMAATVLPQATIAWPTAAELPGENLGPGTLTLGGSGAATITPPPGLSLVLPAGGSYNLKRTSANQWSAAGQFLPADVATLLATTTRPGLLPKLDNVATHFMNGQGAFSAPVGGGGSPAALTGLPTGAIAQTIGRGAGIASPLTILSGREYYFLIWLPEGVTANSITWYSGGTALSAGTNQWSAIRSLSRALIAISPDDTSGAWGASSPKTFTYSTPYPIVAAGWHYATLMVAASTPPSLIGSADTVQVNTAPPIFNGNDATNTGRTNVASAPATGAALTVGTIQAYAHVNGS